MAVKRRPSSLKNPPVLSHDFIIQNHADIVACVAMLFVIGLMFQVSSSFASLFIVLHHNVTAVTPAGGKATATQAVLYTSGPKDFAAIFFYLLITIVMHQIIQEYVLDKVNRKLHLSKIKHTKFNESGQLLTFYLASLAWAADIIFRENLLHIRLLWEDYPHTQMTFIFKFFFIVQMAYWMHILPELYFQKVKREDMPARIQYATLHLLFIGGAYIFNYTRLALFLLVLHYVAEAIFHACRLLVYTDRQEFAIPLYRLHYAFFVMVRLGSISLTVLTFWYGLALAPAEMQGLDPSAGIFNNFPFRMGALVAVTLLQAWLMWNFITFHLRRMREDAVASQFAAAAAITGVVTKVKRATHEKPKARKRKEESNNDVAEDELPEVDQNTKQTLRQRK